VFLSIHELPPRMMSNAPASKFFLIPSTIFHNRFTSHSLSITLFDAIIESSFVLEVKSRNRFAGPSPHLNHLSGKRCAEAHGSFTAVRHLLQ
jgi:hypothetical protein